MEDQQSKKRRKVTKMVKVTELDYKILALERNPTLSIKEKERLESLRVQKRVASSVGLNTLKTAKVPSEWMGENGADKDKNVIENGVDKDKNVIENGGSSSRKNKPGYCNAFFLFRTERKAALTSVDPGAKLDLKEIRIEWKNMLDALKEPYRKKAEEEKIRIGKKVKKVQLSKEERKTKKIIADRKHRLKIKMSQCKRLEDDNLCSQKFQKILESKTVLLKEDSELIEKLTVNEGKLKIENDLLLEMIKEKEGEIDKLKEMYRLLHRTHKLCSFTKN
jgi:hypothetical protein